MPDIVVELVNGIQEFLRQHPVVFVRPVPTRAAHCQLGQPVLDGRAASI
jgi:hypothetical protein